MSAGMFDAPLYMICIRLSGKRAVVAGGGPVAFEKTERLLACGASVVVVAPAITKRLRALADEGSIEWRARDYVEADLDGALIALAATDDEDTGRRIFEDAEARGILVNVHDVPARCNFILPAITRSGPIAIAISTSGASPALAKRMKREIAEAFGEPYGRLAEILNEYRDWAKQTLPTFEARRDFFASVVEASPDPVDLLRSGDERGVRALIEDAQRAASPRP